MIQFFSDGTGAFVMTRLIHLAWFNQPPASWWRFSNIFYVHPETLGRFAPILTSAYFFRWGWLKTHQLRLGKTSGRLQCSNYFWTWPDEAWIMFGVDPGGAFRFFSVMRSRKAPKKNPNANGVKRTLPGVNISENTSQKN